MDIAFLPHWFIQYFTRDFNKHNDLNILLSNLFIIFSFVLFKNSLIDFLNTLPHFCLFNQITKIECPFCGITRGLCELSKGNFSKAFYFNFSSLVVSLGFIFQLPLRIVSLSKKGLKDNVNRISKFLGYFIIFYLLFVWFYKNFVL
jgi:hypothetical protein